MGARYRICETCVYCSFAGNCDRYDKPLTSIEQPACDAYEIHPLLAENAKLRDENAKLREYIERKRDLMHFARLVDENSKLRELVRWMYERMDESCAAQYPYAPTPISYDRLMQALARARELGVEVDDG